MISLRSLRRVQMLLVRPGSTTFDEQGRLKGSLDVPLCEYGQRQADDLAEELASVKIDAVYCAPCEFAMQTAQRLAKGRDIKPRTLDELRNLDMGLWHGKLIDEIRRTQPRLYRAGSSNAESVCPPGGEPLRDAAQRVAKAVRRVLRKTSGKRVAMVIPEPLASLLVCEMHDETLPDLWGIETAAGNWQLLDVTT